MDRLTKNIDISAYTNALREDLKAYHMQHEIEKAKAAARMEGYEAGIQTAIRTMDESRFACDLDHPSYAKGVDDMLYELGKELDIGCSDIRGLQTGTDEKAALFADRIRSFFQTKTVDDTVSS